MISGKRLKYLGFGAILVLASGFAMAPVPAAGQVFDIAPDGAVAVYRGPVSVGPDGDHRALAARTRSASQPAKTGQFRRAATANRLSEALIAAVAWQESRFHQDAVSVRGARGVMQLMPGTARRMGVNPDDPAQNIAGGSAYLAQLLRQFDGDIINSLAAYNAGPAAVTSHHGVPPYPETRAYVNAILGRLADQMDPVK